jgi:hypothetical protein
MEARTLRSILKRMSLSITVHGFRSTFRDFCGDQTNFPREHVEACLAHRVGNSVELAYRRKTALKKRREILDAWLLTVSLLCRGGVTTTLRLSAHRF